MKPVSNYDKAVELEAKGKSSMRSCWECNPAHKHLKKVGGLFECLDCGRLYMNGGYFHNNEAHCNAPFVEREPLKTVSFTIPKLNEI